MKNAVGYKWMGWVWVKKNTCTQMNILLGIWKAHPYISFRNHLLQKKLSHEKKNTRMIIGHSFGKLLSLNVENIIGERSTIAPTLA